MGFFTRLRPSDEHGPCAHIEPSSTAVLHLPPVKPVLPSEAKAPAPALSPPSCWSLSPPAPTPGPGSGTATPHDPARQRWHPLWARAAAASTDRLTQAGSESGGDDDLCSRFDNVMTLIDREEYAGHEVDSFAFQSTPSLSVDRSLASLKPRSPVIRKKPSAGLYATTAAVSGRYFSKVDLYANSRLPPSLPAFAPRGSDWPSVVRLAAQCSLRVYSPPTGPERRQSLVVPADRRSGSKAMYIRSVPDDAARTVVVAVRGTASFADWAVNLRADPVPPLGFLDDPGNACHAGFLSVARAMVAPVARRLREMLDDDPSRARYSLVLTGHSAGGAVAALLYMHMLATIPEAQGHLSALAGCFRRVHCVTFGAPPVSLLPLTKPKRRALRKSLFLSFVNEGDPVTRADKAFIKSLFALLRSPPPSSRAPGDSDKKKKATGNGCPPPPRPHWNPPVWTVPPSKLSNAGSIVVLRSVDPHAPTDRKSLQDRIQEGVVAVTCREDQLRGIIWGDPVCHLMRLYASRVERLAAAAETGRTSITRRLLLGCVLPPRENTAA